MIVNDALPDWRALNAYLTNTYGMVPSDQPGFVSFTRDIDGTITKVGCFHLSSRRDREWVAVLVRICQVSRVSASATLIKNYDLPIGVLGFFHNTLVVRQTLPLDGLTARQLDQTSEVLINVRSAVREAIDGAANLENHPFNYLVSSASGGR